MKRQTLFMSIVTFFTLSTLAQTPYDNFAPEQSVKAIIEMPKTHFKVANTDPNNEICSIEFDNNTLSLNLLNESDSVLKSIALNPDDKKFISIDPLAEKYYHISPYAYCMNNPISYIDPNGMDVYRFDDKTGEMHLFMRTDDKFDQIGQFKYDKKTETYTLKTNRKGEARTRIDNIEKGILGDGMNFMTNDNMWAVGSAGQPTVEGFQSFVIGFAEMINKEVSGYYLNQSGTPDVVSNIYMGQYIKNNATTSYKGRVLEVNTMTLNGTHQLHTDWHTHPTYGYSNAARTTASPQDRKSKANTLRNPNLNQRPSHFMILTNGYSPIFY